jgi:CBS domain-containing protein
VLRYTGGKADWTANALPTDGIRARAPRVATLTRTDVLLCAPDERLGDVQQRARRADADFAVVVDAARVVLGILERDAMDWDSDRRVEDAMAPGPQTVRPNLSLEQAKEHLERYGRHRALVTTSAGALIGVVELADVQRAAA